MKIEQFVKDFKDKKIQNTKINENAVSEYLRKELDIKTYLPFRDKRAIVEMVVAQNTEWVDGVKRNDSINQYIAFVTAMISAHTTLEFGLDPVADYDLLAQNGLLSPIIEEFRASYDECDILLKMALTSELEDNNINVLVGKFLNGILERLDGVGEILKDKIENVNIKDILGGNFKQEDLANLKRFLDRYNN